MRKIRRSTWIIIASFVVGFAVPALGALLFPDAFFSSREQVRGFLERFGAWAPVIFVAVSIVPVVVTPLNHSVFGLAAGFMYGPWIGFLLNWMAKVVGTLINFAIGRALGRGVIRNWASEEVLTDYDALFEKGKLALFFLYAVPFLTNDMLSYFAGVSAIRFRVFLGVMAFGHVGTCLSLAYLGSGADLKDPWFIAIVALTLLACVGYIYAKPGHVRHETATTNTKEAGS